MHTSNQSIEQLLDERKWLEYKSSFLIPFLFMLIAALVREYPSLSFLSNLSAAAFVLGMAGISYFHIKFLKETILPHTDYSYCTWKPDSAICMFFLACLIMVLQYLSDFIFEDFALMADFEIKILLLYLIFIGLFRSTRILGLSREGIVTLWGLNQWDSIHNYHWENNNQLVIFVSENINKTGKKQRWEIPEQDKEFVDTYIRNHIVSK
jgi:hypothetical protein